MLFTPLEMLKETKSFCGDMIKVERWALGCLLHYVLLGGYPSWVYSITQAITAIDMRLSDDKIALFEDFIEAQVEGRRERLMQSKKSSRQIRLEMIVLDLLREDPNERISAADAVLRLISEQKN